MAGLKLYLLRHGETEASRDGGYCGRSDPELTETGRLMAEDFALAYQLFRVALRVVAPLAIAISPDKISLVFIFVKPS